MRDPQSEDLLKRLQQGDERALADLAAQYGAKIYQLAFRYLRNHEDAEEVGGRGVGAVGQVEAEAKGQGAAGQGDRR